MTTAISANYAGTSSTALDRPKDLKQAAEAFEGMFLAMLLKTARQASTSENSTGSSDTVLEMAEEHLATQIAKGRGCGFASAILKQLSPPPTTLRPETADTATANEEKPN